jgi:hypothetical protein
VEVHAHDVVDSHLFVHLFVAYEQKRHKTNG